jgi:hypothetical protein
MHHQRQLGALQELCHRNYQHRRVRTRHTAAAERNRTVPHHPGTRSGRHKRLEPGLDHCKVAEEHTAIIMFVRHTWRKGSSLRSAATSRCNHAHAASKASDSPRRSPNQTLGHRLGMTYRT